MSKLSDLRAQEMEMQANIEVAYQDWQPQKKEAERLQEIWQVRRNALSAIQREIIAELQSRVDSKESAA